MAVRTYVILDGLQDPLHGRELSVRWKTAGFDNAVDPAGQAAWLSRGEPEEAAKNSGASDTSGNEGEDAPTNNGARSPLSEEEVGLAGAVARGFGVEARDRAGKTFVSENNLPALREQITYEYRMRFAQAIVFGLPALCTHYLAPILAMGSGQSAANMAYPWLFEMALVAWAMWVGGLPVLWQGMMSLLHLRATADLFVSFVVAAAFIPSVYGLVSLLWTDEPWFGTPDQGGGPMFHVAMWVMLIALAQRYLMYRRLSQLSGKANRMLPHFGRLIRYWLLVVVAVFFMMGWQAGLAVALVLPPMMSIGAVNNWSPGWSMALPAIAFVPALLFGPDAMDVLAAAEPIRVEIAACFGVLMTAVFAIGWRQLSVSRGIDE